MAEITSQPWFATTSAASSNHDFYKSRLPAADVLLFGGLPWIDASVGERFTVVDKEGKSKQKRKIFLRTASIPVEAIISESKLGRKKLSAGDAIRVKGEFEEGRGFKLYMLEERNSVARWDIFSERTGIVDHVKIEKGVLHFIVNREINGVIPLSELDHHFVEGDSIAVWVSRYASKRGAAYRVLLANITDKQPDSDVKKDFNDEVRVSNGMGFVGGDVFISPPLVSRHQIEDGQRVSGTAVLGFNKKRGNWGWRAISIAQG